MEKYVRYATMAFVALIGIGVGIAYLSQRPPYHEYRYVYGDYRPTRLTNNTINDAVNHVGGTVVPCPPVVIAGTRNIIGGVASYYSICVDTTWGIEALKDKSLHTFLATWVTFPDGLWTDRRGSSYATLGYKDTLEIATVNIWTAPTVNTETLLQYIVVNGRSL